MVELIDNTGKPRSNKDIEETITAAKTEMIKGKPVPIMVYYGTIIECLNELLQRRNNDTLNKRRKLCPL